MRGLFPASQSNIANHHVLAQPCCETQQRWRETSKYFFSKPYDNYIKYSLVLDQLSCPVHSTAPWNSRGSTTKQVLDSGGRNYLQQSCHWRFRIIEWWSVPAANPLGTKMLPPVPSHLMDTESTMWKCFVGGFVQARKSGDARSALAQRLLGRQHGIT